MKNLFISVGISNNDQVDKETIDFIYDFVEKNGGIEQVKKEMLSRPPPPPPPSGTLYLSKTPLTPTPAFMIWCWGLRVRAHTILKTKKHWISMFLMWCALWLFSPTKVKLSKRGLESEESRFILVRAYLQSTASLSITFVLF